MKHIVSHTFYGLGDVESYNEITVAHIKLLPNEDPLERALARWEKYKKRVESEVCTESSIQCNYYLADSYHPYNLKLLYHAPKITRVKPLDIRYLNRNDSSNPSF